RVIRSGPTPLIKCPIANKSSVSCRRGKIYMCAFLQHTGQHASISNGGIRSFFRCHGGGQFKTPCGYIRIVEAGRGGIDRIDGKGGKGAYGRRLKIDGYPAGTVCFAVIGSTTACIAIACRKGGKPQIGTGGGAVGNGDVYSLGVSQIKIEYLGFEQLYGLFQ